MNNQRLLSLILILGGIIVGGIILWLMNIYIQEGLFSRGIAIVSSMIALLLAVPQIGFGIFLLRRKARETAVSPRHTEQND